MSWHKKELASLLIDARPGFASGDDLDEGVFQIRMNNVTRDGALNLSKRRRINVDEKKLGGVLLETGDVLFNATNSPELVGKSAYIAGLDEATTYSNHFVRLRPRPDALDGNYLARWLHTLFQAGKFNGLCKQWVNQATVSRESLLALDVPLPPLPEQRRIAAILDKADALRTKRREALAQLDRLAQAIFVEMFGDPVSNTKGWHVTKLGAVGSLDRGVSKHRPRNDPKLLGGSHPLIQTGDVANSGGYIREFGSTYSEFGLKQSKLWPKGTLCITIAANIAKTGILTFDACFPDSVVGFTAAQQSTIEYVRVWLSFLQKTLEENAPESAQKNINLAILRDLDIPLPPDNLREKFALAIRGMNELSNRMVVAGEQLEALFSSLQHRAFRGEL